MTVYDSNGEFIFVGEPNAFQEWGILYGFPSCCITHFGMYGPNQLGWIAGDSTGFVPCPSCALKVLCRQCDLKDLIVGRIDPTPFPFA